MRQVDMSAEAVTARLKQVSQLRRLCLSLRKAQFVVKEKDEKQEAKRPNASSSLDRGK